MICVVARYPNHSLTNQIKDLFAVSDGISNCSLEISSVAFIPARKVGEIKDDGLSFFGICQFPEISLEINRDTTFIDFTAIWGPTDKYSCIRRSN